MNAMMAERLCGSHPPTRREVCGRLGLPLLAVEGDMQADDAPLGRNWTGVKLVRSGRMSGGSELELGLGMEGEALALRRGGGGWVRSNAMD